MNLKGDDNSLVKGSAVNPDPRKLHKILCYS